MVAPRNVRRASTDSTPTPPPVAVAGGEFDAWRRSPSKSSRRAGVWAACLGAAVGGLIALWTIRAEPASSFALANLAPSLRAATEALPDVAVAVRESLAPAASDESAEPDEPRADRNIHRDRHASIHGGVLFVPSTFASADGAYDLYVHFHGNTRVVLESAEHAGVNALVAVVNLGVGSAPYEDAYAMPGSYRALLASIDRGAAERGLEHPHVRRIALGSWSAGYGALQGILRKPEGHEKLDALFVLDGIHVGYLDDDSTVLNVRNLGPFVDAARAAARGELFFSITHSEIIPEGYASSTVTANVLLDAVGAVREASDADNAPPHMALAAAEGAVAKRLEKFMEPTTEAHIGSLHVRGYRGNTPEHHMAHLLQMGATVMPELASRWEN